MAVGCHEGVPAEPFRESTLNNLAEIINLNRAGKARVSGKYDKKPVENRLGHVVSEISGN